jgi:Aspartic acid proteinase inhibitor/Sporulation and spore germination
MRKSLLKVLAAASLCVVIVNAAAVASARQTPPLAGGYGDARVSERGVLEAARFAVREEGRREGRRVSLVAVRRAETQVVAGLNYRLRLSVRAGGRTRDATAVVYRNLKGVYSLTSWDAGGDAATTREVKVYLVAVGDAGKAGRKIGCDDSLVPVKRRVRADGAPLKAAVSELLSVPHEYEGGLGNYWFGENLRVSGATLSGGTATIRITGRLFVAGVCDEPRIEEQIRETARQFPGVRRVKVFVNGRTLASVIR